MRARDRLALLLGGAAFGGVVLAMTATSDSAMEARLRRILARDVAAPCTFASCSFSFLEGFEVQGLTVLDASDPFGEPLVRVGEARIDYHLDVLGGGPRLTDVHLWAPALRLVRADDGGFPLLRVLRGTGESAPGATPGIALPPIFVHGGTLVFGDPAVLAPGETVALRSIDLRLTPGAAADEFSVRGRATGDFIGPLRLEANLADWGRRITVGLDLEGAEIGPDLADRLGGRVAELVRDLAATGTVTGRVDLTIDGAEIVDMTGEATLSDVALRVALPEASPDHEQPERLTVTGAHGRVDVRDGALWVLGVDGRIESAAFHANGVIDVPLPGEAPNDAARTLDIKATVTGLRVDDELATRIPWSVRRVQEAYDFEGAVDVALGLEGPLEQPRVTVGVEVLEANASYVGYHQADGVRRGFPYRVTSLTGTVHVDDLGSRFEAEGRHGKTPITVKGSVAADAVTRDLDTDVTISASDVAIDDDLRAAFGDRVEETLGPWRPSGTVESVTVRVTHVRSIDGPRTALDIELGLDGRASMYPEMFPTQLDGITGTVRIGEPIEDGRRVPTVEVHALRARGDGLTISADGKIVGAGEETVEDLVVRADIAQLEGPIRDAVTRSSRAPEKLAAVLARFDPHGRASVRLRLRGGDDGREDDLQIELVGASLRGGDDIPMQLLDVSGTLTLAGDAISGGIAGRALGAPFEATGRVDDLSAAEQRYTLDVMAIDLPIGSALRDDLGGVVANIRDIWDNLGIGANARADVELSLRPDGVAPRPLTLRLGRLRGDLAPLGLPSVVENGSVAFDGREAIVAFEGTLGQGELKVERASYDVQTGRLWALLAARGLDTPECIAPALPEHLVTALSKTLPARSVHIPAAEITWDPERQMLEIVGDLSVWPRKRDDVHADGLRAEGTLHVEHLGIHVPDSGSPTFTGRALAEEVTFHPGLDVGDFAGRLELRGSLDPDVTRVVIDVSEASLLAGDFPLSDASFTMDVAGSLVRIQHIAATLYGGALTGSFSSGNKTVAYRGRMKIEGADLQEISPDQGEEANQGFLDGVVQFRNKTGDSRDLVGSGSVRLRDGKVGRVPVLTTVLNTIDSALLGAGVRGHFREGGMMFDVRGHELEIENLHLSGPEMPDPLPGSLGLRNGRGRISLEDQRVDLVVEPRIGLGVLTLDPTGVVTGILNTAQWFLLRELRVEGTLRNPRASWQVLPTGSTDEMRPRPQPAGELRPYGEFPW